MCHSRACLFLSLSAHTPLLDLLLGASRCKERPTDTRLSLLPCAFLGPEAPFSDEISNLGPASWFVSSKLVPCVISVSTVQPQYLSATTRVARHFSLRDRRRALKGALLLPFSPRCPDAAKKTLSFCTSPSHRLHHGPCPVWSPLLHARRDRLDRVAVS